MGTTTHVTTRLPAEPVQGIDRLDRNRSRFVAHAVERELARRHRDGLLQSLRSPHAEASILPTGVSDWMVDLPQEEALVDLATGTAVRWIEGTGWLDEAPKA